MRSDPASENSSTFLRQVPVLAALPEELLETLAAEAGEVAVRAGEWLLREGDPAESLFVVRSGRLEVLAEGPPETVIRIIRRGEVLGELALLQGGTRSTSVRAQRDSELLELGRSQFETLISEAPSFALALTRAMGAQLAASRAPAVGTKSPQTFAVVALDPGGGAERAAELLAEELRRHGSLATLAADSDLGAEEMAGALDRAERDADRVMLIGGASSPGDPWTDFCLHEAELVLALTAGAPDRRWEERRAALLGCELVVVGGSAPEHLIEALAPGEVQVLAGDAELRRGLASTARRIAGRAVGVVLSGGGARAFAHLGVLEELRAAGITIDRIGAVSLGGIVGAATATGLEPDEIYESFVHSFVETNPANDFAPPVYSLTRGDKVRRLLGEAFGDVRIEELPTRFFCVSCDLLAREAVVHRTGPLCDALYASLAIPGVFPPVSTGDGRMLVDGGVIDNLPVATMARRGEGPVIAVDVSGSLGGQVKAPSRPRLRGLARPVRRLLTGSEDEIPRLGETILRTVAVGSSDTVAAARLHADLVITPRVGGIGLMDWKQLPRVRELGREAAIEALASAPASLAV